MIIFISNGFLGHPIGGGKDDEEQPSPASETETEPGSVSEEPVTGLTGVRQRGHVECDPIHVSMQ